MIHSVLSGKKRRASVISPILSFILFMSPLFSPSVNTYAQSLSGNLIFILDASGSMELKIKEKTRTEIVREALSALVGSLHPAGPNVGLTVFGHRYKGDCNDVEEILPLAPLNKEVFVTKLQSLYPSGMTAIALSFEKISESLRNSPDQTTVILIADGEDSCNGNPCDSVKNLKARGLKFIMHVIGFDMSPTEGKSLECSAKAGGGRYFSAGNAEELSRALKKALESPGFKKGSPISAGAETAKSLEPAADISRTQSPAKQIRMKADAGFVREKPLPESPVRFRLKKGDTVSLLETKNDWYRIQADENRTGWAASRLFSDSDAARSSQSPSSESEKALRGNEIKEIRFERTSESEQLVFVQSIGLKPNLFFLKEDIPKFVCDFPGTRMDRKASDILTRGDWIRKIRFGIYSGSEAKLRVVSDMAPGRNYRAEEIFLKESGQYILRVRPAP